MSEIEDYKDLEPHPEHPALRQTPASGRHAILPGAGLPPPQTIAPLRRRPSLHADLPDLDIPGRLPEDEPHRIDRGPDLSGGTEASLNALIAECHFFMKEVAFRCVIQTTEVNDRMQFMDAARSFALTGAAVGKSVAKLRAASSTAAPQTDGSIASRSGKKISKSGKQ